MLKASFQLIAVRSGGTFKKWGLVGGPQVIGGMLLGGTVGP